MDTASVKDDLLVAIQDLKHTTLCLSKPFAGSECNRFICMLSTVCTWSHYGIAFRSKNL